MTISSSFCFLCCDGEGEMEFTFFEFVGPIAVVVYSATTLRAFMTGFSEPTALAKRCLGDINGFSGGRVGLDPGLMVTGFRDGDGVEGKEIGYDVEKSLD